MYIIAETGLFRYGIHKGENHMILMSAEAPCKVWGYCMEQWAVYRLLPSGFALWYDKRL